MNTLNFFRKRILALLVAATALVACSKDSDSEPNNPIEVPKGNYGVLIGGVELTSENYQKINKENFPAITEGTVAYDPIQRVLTLNGATINATGKEVAAIRQPKGITSNLTIVLKNKSTLNSEESAGIAVGAANLRITGKESLTINPNQEKLSISAEDLTIEGGCFINADRQIRVEKTLTINKAKVHVKEDGYAAFIVYGEINLIDCKVVFPKEAEKGQYKSYNYNTFVKDGNFCKEVKIEISK